MFDKVIYKYIGKQPKRGSWNTIKIIKSRYIRKTDTLFLYAKIISSRKA